MFQAFSQRNAARSQRAGKDNEEEGGPEGESIDPLPHPLAVFVAHISLRRPHKLNTWNRLHLLQ